MTFFSWLYKQVNIQIFPFIFYHMYVLFWLLPKSKHVSQFNCFSSYPKLCSCFPSSVKDLLPGNRSGVSTSQPITAPDKHKLPYGFYVDCGWTVCWINTPYALCSPLQPIFRLVRFQYETLLRSEYINCAPISGVCTAVLSPEAGNLSIHVFQL